MSSVNHEVFLVIFRWTKVVATTVVRCTLGVLDRDLDGTSQLLHTHLHLKEGGQTAQPTCQPHQ